MEDLKDGSPRDTPPPPVDSTTNLHAPHNERGSCESQTPPLNTTASDADRLRMLGYDAVLGRPFGFWGSAAMNICQLNFVNEFYLSSQNWGYRGPLLWVSSAFVKLFARLLMLTS